MAGETTFFDGFGEQKVLAERARKDINGNSLELTIAENLVTAIGGVSVAGSGSETNIIETVEVEGTPLTVTNKTVNVTKADLSLNNVTNDSQVKRTEMGAANGVATLDAYGHIPSIQIPGSYDDVRNGYYYTGEFYYDAEHTQIMEHVDDILYVDVTTNIPYRWTGTTYTRTGSDLSLGTTEFTAYRGDHGLAAYEHSLVASGNPHNVTKSDVGLGNVDNTSDSTKKSNFTGSIADSDTGFVTGGDVYTALSGKVDAVSGKGLSTNDYTTLEQTKLSGIESGAQVNTIESISYGGTALTPDNQKNVDVPAVVVANGGNINVTSTTADNTTTYAVSVDSTDFEVDQDTLKVTYPEGKIQLAVRNPLPTTEIDDSVLVGSYDTTGQEQGGIDTYNWRALTKTTVTDSPSNTELYSALNSVKFLAERTYKDINGNSLELTISDNKVAAIGSLPLAGEISAIKMQGDQSPLIPSAGLVTIPVDSSILNGSTNPISSTAVHSAIDTTVAALPSSKDIDNMSMDASYDSTNKRLILENIVFDSIYPVVGKYGLATFPEDTAVDATAFDGDREWLLDWRPYLVDMSPVQGEIRKTPVAELQKNNWLRKIDGSFAPAVGITETQKTALDGKAASLYWKSDLTGDTVATTVPAAFDNDGNFVPEILWEYLKAHLSDVNTLAGTSYNFPIEVKVYSEGTAYSYGDYTTNHIPAPWETTETKYSVFIGRETDVYLVDGSEKYGEYMRGLTAKPVSVGSSQFDPEFFKLSRTGISPGPSTTVGGKIRNFFYNYPGTDSNTAGYPSANAACFKNNGTYPRTDGVSQYTVVQMARACNPGGSNGVAYPVAEGGFHALNAFLCSLEAAYGNRNLWDTSKFSAGISSNDTSNNGIWNGSSFTAWSNGTYGTVNANNQYAKFQCMEPQIATSLAAEMGIAENAEFKWNGGVWHFEIPSMTGIKTLADGSMNCRIYKKITEGLSSAVPAGGYYMLRCALAEGVNPTGDIYVFMGGGCELVYETTDTGAQNYQYSFYLEPDQTKWIFGSYVTTPHVTGTYYDNEKHTDNSKFHAENLYTAIITDSTVGGLGQGYSLSRTGYTPLRKIAGGAYNTGECAYNHRQIDDDGKGSVGIRTRRRVMFRGNANNVNCSPRYLNANSRPSTTNVAIGCAAQVLLA